MWRWECHGGAARSSAAALKMCVCSACMLVCGSNISACSSSNLSLISQYVVKALEKWQGSLTASNDDYTIYIYTLLWSKIGGFYLYF